MLLLISPINTDEALEAIEGGADIIDVKNPKEGSLGCELPVGDKEYKGNDSRGHACKCDTRRCTYKPGTVSLAAAGAVVSGGDYIKVGLYGTKNFDEALEVMENVVRSVREFDKDALIVASGYADAHRIGAVDPMEIPRIASDSGADLAMLDTAVKDGSTLFDHMDSDKLQIFNNTIHDYGLKSALAGSVKKNQLKLLDEIGCDVVGIREQHAQAAIETKEVSIVMRLMN